MFTPELKIVLRTSMERELEVKINEYYQKDIKDKIINLFSVHEKNRLAEL